MQNPSSQDNYWYRKRSNTNTSSVAVDNLNDRAYLNKNADNKGKERDIRAYTPEFEISLESDSKNNGTWEAKNNTDIPEYVIGNINFGIIDTPKIELGFEKNITNVKITNTQGNVIVDGNPKMQKVKYVSNLDSRKTHIQSGSNYVKMEIKDEELYGSKLEITYTITVLNNSDTNYYEDSSQYYGYYYKFGETNHAYDEVNITINKVEDYLDTNLTLSGTDHKITNENNYKENNNISTIDGGKNVYTLNIEDDGNGVKYWKNIYTQKNKTRSQSKPSQDNAKIVATRTLSNEDEDMEFVNRAKVTSIEVTNTPPLVEDVNVNLFSGTDYENYFKYEDGDTFSNAGRLNTVTITPPTGIDMFTIVVYATVLIIASGIIAIGIINIKKKVLNK